MVAQVELQLFVVLFSQPFAQSNDRSGRTDSNFIQFATCYIVNTITPESLLSLNLGSL